MNWKFDSGRRDTGESVRLAPPRGPAGSRFATFTFTVAGPLEQPRPARRRALFAAVLAATLCAYCSLAAGAESASDRLSQLRTRLERLEHSLEHTRGERDAQREALRNIEVQIGDTLRRLRQLGIERRRQQEQLLKLRTQQQQERHEIGAQLHQLENEARAAYILGRQEYLKLLLNQEDPATVSRVLTYYRYLQRARTEQIAAARTALGRLTRLGSLIQRRQQALARLRVDQLGKRRALLHTEARRRILLASLNRRFASQSQEVERLRSNERRLGRLVKGIQSAIAGTAPVPLPGPNSRFAEFRGRLPLPVAGRIVDRFGEPEGIGNLRWQGIFLAAPEGSKVISVFNGRVAFANWLRGFGLLMIIDHGDGYMSLYAHNQSLYEQTGDWVRAGQVIATVGNTGGARQSGLYFEVLHDERPVNPLNWCRMR